VRSKAANGDDLSVCTVIASGKEILLWIERVVRVVAFVEAEVRSKAAGGNDLSVCTVTASGEQIGCC